MSKMITVCEDEYDKLRGALKVIRDMTAPMCNLQDANNAALQVVGPVQTRQRPHYLDCDHKWEPKDNGFRECSVCGVTRTPADSRRGENVKVYLPGESPWVEVIEESDGKMKGRIINKLFHEHSEHEQAQVMKRDWDDVGPLKKLHDYKQGDEVWFERGFSDEWVPVEQGLDDGN